MSGRSAYVRKEKTKEKKTKANGEHGYEQEEDESVKYRGPGSVVGDYQASNGSQPRKPAKSITSDHSHDDMAYARVKKPVLPSLDVSGIEKSSFREKMDKKSEGVRKGIAGLSFGKKKKNKQDQPEERPQTSATVRPPMPHDVESRGGSDSPPPFKQRENREDRSESGNRPPPPTSKLPPIPPPPQLKRWSGSGRTPHPWNKLRKDPELWDSNGDTFIYLSHESHQAARPPPSFRVSSHVLEATGSQYLVRMLREGYTDFYSDSDMPPSPISSAGGYFKQGQRNYRVGHPPLSPMSEEGGHDMHDTNGQISYELFFPAPINQTKVESIRYHSTTRNVFALLYQASLVGLNLLQALNDLHERIRMYMAPDIDSSEMIIDYITSKRLDDARNDPETAISLLVWSENKSVHWQEGWCEFFVHCVGMHNHLDRVQEMRHITPITKALLERASLEMEVRGQNAADRLADFNFYDMWPAMSPHPPPERAAFDRLRDFFQGFYESAFGTWPPRSPAADEVWLTRDVVQRLQSDFGALYDYLVNREVYWENVEERSTRKWQMAHSNPDKSIQPDSTALPMTDILIAFDNRHQYPHIPHPYPLVPDSMPLPGSQENLYKASKNLPKPPVENKMAERRIALAYTEATNIYILGPDFVSNKLADAFMKFEKSDQASEIDPHAARRGRWVLLYGILQVLASVSANTPGLRYKDDVSYHLSARLRGTPPWKSHARVDEASHEGSYCWLAPKSWSDANASTSESDVPMLDSLSVSPVASPRARGAKLTASSHSSLRSSVAMSVAGTVSSTGSMRSPRSAHRKMYHHMPKGTVKEVDHLGSPGGLNVQDWPVHKERERSRQKNGNGHALPVIQPLTIKDFDDYQF